MGKCNVAAFCKDEGERGLGCMAVGENLKFLTPTIMDHAMPTMGDGALILRANNLFTTGAFPTACFETAVRC